MGKMRVWIHGLPLPARWALVAAATLGIVGAVAGLVIGLGVYEPTAPFAIVELGVPAALAGGILGLAAGMAVTANRRFRRNHS